MAKEYIAFRFEKLDLQLKDILLGLLPQAGFEGFEEEDEHTVIAYAQDGQIDKSLLEQIIATNNLSPSQSTIEEKNWNAEWESSFEPVVIPGKVAVRASFHPPVTGVMLEIIITPKMSFGTGHHATTFLMMETILDFNLNQKKVFDFGTGTGILAILAEKRGASEIKAVDNDEWSINNAKENIQVNDCSKISLCLSSSIDTDKKYDYIFANINKGVILENKERLYESLVKEGVLILSGLLITDQAEIVSSFHPLLGNPLLITEKNNWISLAFKR